MLEEVDIKHLETYIYTSLRERASRPEKDQFHGEKFTKVHVPINFLGVTLGINCHWSFL